MKQSEYYININVDAPQRVGNTIVINRYNNQIPTLYIQLFKNGVPYLLEQATGTEIVFTDTDQKSVKGSGILAIDNPYRGTLTYKISDKDLISSGLITVTLAIYEGSKFFTVQFVIQCNSLNKSIYSLLSNGGNGGTTDDTIDGSSDNTDDFPCTYYSIYCRSCRRCLFAWNNNSYEKPVPFSLIKVCSDIPIMENQPDFKNDSNYVKSDYTLYKMALDGEFYVKDSDNNYYLCDINDNGKIRFISYNTITNELYIDNNHDIYSYIGGDTNG